MSLKRNSFLLLNTFLYNTRKLLKKIGKCVFSYLFSDFNSLTEGEKRKDVFYCVSRRKTKHVDLNQRDAYPCFFKRHTYKMVEQGPLKKPPPLEK